MSRGSPDGNYLCWFFHVAIQIKMLTPKKVVVVVVVVAVVLVVAVAAVAMKWLFCP